MARDPAAPDGASASDGRGWSATPDAPGPDGGVPTTADRSRDVEVLDGGVGGVGGVGRVAGPADRSSDVEVLGVEVLGVGVLGVGVLGVRAHRMAPLVGPS